MAAVVKCNVRRHINEKNNVENSKEFVDAAKNTKYLSIFASKIVPHLTANKPVTSTKRVDWPGITMFNNLQYEIKTKSKGKIKEAQIPSNICDEIELKAWRSYNIGSGKKFIWSNLNTVKDIDQLVVTYEPSQTHGNWMNENIKEGSFYFYFSIAFLFLIFFLFFRLDGNDNYLSNSDLEEEEEESEDNNRNDFAKKNPELMVFDCPDSNCIRQFRRHANLQAHLATGTHKYPPNRLKLLDKAKLYYQEQLENDKAEHIRSIQNFKVIYSSKTDINDELKQGWALFNRKPRK
jgi:hypothetical protein